MSLLPEPDARISTARLELAPLSRDHAEDMYSVLSDVSLYEYVRGVPPASVFELHARYAYLESRRSADGTEAWLNWILFEIATGMSIGYVQATVTSQHADIAWVVGTLWQRRGFATEAAQAMVVWLRCTGVRVIRAKIHPEHTASQRVAENAGLSPTHETIEGERVWTYRI
jgi:RimJ/RimL family protein N-acetyltransferase